MRVSKSTASKSTLVDNSASMQTRLSTLRDRSNGIPANPRAEEKPTKNETKTKVNAKNMKNDTKKTTKTMASVTAPIQKQPAVRRSPRGHKPVKGNSSVSPPPSTSPLRTTALSPLSERQNVSVNINSVHVVVKAPVVVEDVVATPAVTAVAPVAIPDSNTANLVTHHLDVSPPTSSLAVTTPQLTPNHMLSSAFPKINWNLYNNNSDDFEVICIASGLVNTTAKVLSGENPIWTIVDWLDPDLTIIMGGVDPWDPAMRRLHRLMPKYIKEMRAPLFIEQQWPELRFAPAQTDMIHVLWPFSQPKDGGSNDWEVEMLRKCHGCIREATHVATRDTTGGNYVTAPELLRALACKLYVIGCEVLMRAAEGKSLLRGVPSYWLHPDMRQGMRRLAGLETTHAGRAMQA